MTQQDIVNELNRMVVGYNINWQMIKYDADRAIMKINAHLGAEYPMMSKIMQSPTHRYTLLKDNKEIPIFPERYILTVVIPFIATEILARDEEFTTIYNKYAMDLENGLFDMFQNEYNKVPLVFRQDPDIGVFFSAECPAKFKTIDKDLPDFKFNIYYHFNFADYPYVQQFTYDENEYAYGTDAIVKAPSIVDFIQDHYCIEFKHWCTSHIDTVAEKYAPGDFITVEHDIHLYAIWDKVNILEVTPNLGTVHIKEDYKSAVTNLVIPTFVDGALVTTIPADFDKDTNLVSVTLPKTDILIKQNAFTNPGLRRLIFPDYDYLREKPNILIENSAINNTGISNLYIPYSVATIEVYGITGVPYIECEISSRPTSWDKQFALNAIDIKWGVPNG